MAQITLKKFVELLQKSGLIEDQTLRDVLVQYREEQGGDPLNDVDHVSQRLIADNLITHWQCDKILDQKYKGFYLGKYKLLGHLGTGGMSSVYLAEHVIMRQQRAIKVLPKKKVDDKTYLDRFHLEARAIASLSHPNIVAAHDIDEDNGTHFLVMEYVNGKELNEIVAESGPFDFKAAADFIAQAADGIAHAHERGLVHRDVKPSNLLLDQDNIVKVLDLGLALFKEEEFSLTIAFNEKILGTADYLAPEQAVNSHNVDYRADIYGLGCSLYYALTGHAPFPTGTLAERILKHQTTMPESVSKIRKDCPLALQAILNGMLKKRPENRIQTMGQVAEYLRAFIAGRKILIPAKKTAASQSPKVQKTVEQTSESADQTVQAKSLARQNKNAQPETASNPLTKQIQAGSQNESTGESIGDADPLQGEGEATLDRAEKRDDIQSEMAAPSQNASTAMIDIPELFGDSDQSSLDSIANQQVDWNIVGSDGESVKASSDDTRPAIKRDTKPSSPSSVRGGSEIDQPKQKLQAHKRQVTSTPNKGQPNRPTAKRTSAAKPKTEPPKPNRSAASNSTSQAQSSTTGNRPAASNRVPLPPPSTASKPKKPLSAAELAKNKGSVPAFAKRISRPSEATSISDIDFRGREDQRISQSSTSLDEFVEGAKPEADPALGGISKRTFTIWIVLAVLLSAGFSAAAVYALIQVIK